MAIQGWICTENRKQQYIARGPSTKQGAKDENGRVKVLGKSDLYETCAPRMVPETNLLTSSIH